LYLTTPAARSPGLTDENSHLHIVLHWSSMRFSSTHL